MIIETLSLYFHIHCFKVGDRGLSLDSRQTFTVHEDGLDIVV